MRSVKRASVEKHMMSILAYPVPVYVPAYVPVEEVYDGPDEEPCDHAVRTCSVSSVSSFRSLRVASTSSSELSSVYTSESEICWGH
jgi:hypothetical protein